MKSNIYIYLCISHSSTHKHQYKLQLHQFHSTFQSFSALSWAGYTVCLYQDRRSISISSAPPYLSHLLQIHTLFNLSLLLLSSSSSVHPGSRLFQLPSLPPPLLSSSLLSYNISVSSPSPVYPAPDSLILISLPDVTLTSTPTLFLYDSVPTFAGCVSL